MKIIITGTQCSGKTTLIESIPSKYENLVLKKLIRKTVEDSGYKYRFNEKSDIESQCAFFNLYLNELSKRTDYISDRGLVDVVAYSKWLGEKGKLGTALWWSQKALLKKWIEAHPDEVYLYTVPEMPLTGDGFRSTDETYRQEIDYNIRYILAECGANFFIIKGDVDTRKKIITNLIKAIEKNKKLKFNTIEDLNLNIEAQKVEEEAPKKTRKHRTKKSETTTAEKPKRTRKKKIAE